jgi:hypothetical protein
LGTEDHSRHSRRFSPDARPRVWLHDYGLQFGLRLAMSAPARGRRSDHPERRHLRGPAWAQVRAAQAALARSDAGRPREKLGAAVSEEGFRDEFVRLLDVGHWALETSLDEIVPLVREFLDRVYPPSSPGAAALE